MYSEIPGGDEGIGSGTRHRLCSSRIAGSIRQLIGEDVDLLIDACRPRPIVMSSLQWAVAKGICNHPANDR